MELPQNKSILIIDDEPDICELFKTALESEGFKTHVAYDIKQTEEFLSTQIPDLIILDLMLPGRSGFEFLRDLSKPQFRKTKVIVITGKKIDASTKELLFFEPNVAEFLPKPVKPLALLYRIHQILGTTPKDIQFVEQRRKEWEEFQQQIKRRF